jgi:hypothetical protein
VLAGIKHSAQADVDIASEGENMDTLRFKQLPHFGCRASVPWFLLLTSYFLIFPLRSNSFSLREFAAREILSV